MKKKDSLTKQEKQDIMILQKPKKYFKKFKEDLNKLKRYQLFNDINEEDYYKLIKTSGDFNDNYINYESRGDKDNNLSLEEYLNIIRPYLRDMINNHKSLNEWEIMLIMRINFVSSLDSNKTLTIHTKSDSTEIMSGYETNGIINQLFESF